MMKGPSWQNHHDYNYTAELELSGWAWEFLRRGGDYRVAYAAYLVEAKPLEEKYGANWKEKYEARVHDPTLNENESHTNWIRRCELILGKTPRRLHLHKLRGEEFYLDGMFDPEAQYHQEIRFLAASPFPKRVRSIEDLEAYLIEFEDYDPDDDDHPDYADLAIDPKVGVLAFKLNEALDQQLKSAKKLLLGARKNSEIKKPHSPTRHPSWRNFLRVLDADLEGITLPDIASAIWPKPGPDEDPVSRAKETLRRAKRWTRPKQYSRLLR